MKNWAISTCRVSIMFMFHWIQLWRMNAVPVEALGTWGNYLHLCGWPLLMVVCCPEALKRKSSSGTWLVHPSSLHLWLRQKFFEKVRSLPSSMSSCRFHQIWSGKLEFCRIPGNFNGKHLAGASAILVSHSMEIPTFFQSLQEWFPWESMEFCWNSVRVPWESK